MSLFKHQIDGVKYLIEHGSVIIGDQMGTGKTRLSLAFAKWAINTGNADRMLVLVPALLISNWVREVEEYMGFTPAVYSGKRKELHNNWITVVSYELLRYKKNGIFVHYNALSHYFEGLRVVLVADEGHNLKNDTTNVAIAANQIPAKYRILMTGTPIMNLPEDLYGVLKFCDPRLDKDWFFKTFTIRKLVTMVFGWKKITKWEIQGYKDQKELNQYLAARMIRRLKSECLDLPSKSVIFQPYEQTDSLYRQVEAQCDLSDTNMLTKITRLLQAASGLNPDDPDKTDFKPGVKFAMLEQYLSGLSGKRTIIWFKFYETLRHVHKLLKDRGYDCYQWHGHNHSKREQEVGNWGQSDSGLLLATISAAGVGLNLVEGSTALYYESEISAGLVMQSEDRIHRMGQKEPVTIVYFYGRKTVEESLLNIVQRKKAMGKALTDGFTDSDLSTIYKSALRLEY